MAESNSKIFYREMILGICRKCPCILFTMIICYNALATTSIDTTEAISIGGIKQFISIKGKDKSKPLLLFLHGGPGGSVMSYAGKFTHRLQEKFIVVQWDQRETGKTLAMNTSPVPLTFDLFVNDTHDIITSLLNQFQRNKIYLVGHSWGTALGFEIVRKYPDLLYAYVAISPMINQLESERIILERMKEKAERTKNTQEIKELAQVRIPFETGQDLYYDRKWLFDYNGQKNSTKNFSEKFALSWSATWLSVFNEACRINLLESLAEVKCPVYFCTGRKDYQTNFAITESYFKKVKAPKKDLFWFEGTGHSIPSAKPDLLQKIILEKILPETQKENAD
jgi:pimeloyl-ACP methyl ester carboxylesterase